MVEDHDIARTGGHVDGAWVLRRDRPGVGVVALHLQLEGADRLAQRVVEAVAAAEDPQTPLPRADLVQVDGNLEGEHAAVVDAVVVVDVERGIVGVERAVATGVLPFAARVARRFASTRSLYSGSFQRERASTERELHGSGWRKSGIGSVSRSSDGSSAFGCAGRTHQRAAPIPLRGGFLSNGSA